MCDDARPPIWKISPVEIATTSPMTVRLPFGNVDGTVTNLAVYFAKDSAGPFVALNCAINAGFIAGSALELGFFFVGVPKTAAQMNCP